MSGNQEFSQPQPQKLSPFFFWLRVLCVALQLLLVYFFAQRGELFFYQGF